MAYESTTLTTARREIGRALGIMRYGSITALTTTSVTIPSLYLNTNRGSTQAQDETIILRPDATTAADRKRYIASIATSTGAATVAGGTNYADTTATSEVGEEWQLNIDPDVDILDALNYSLRYTMVRTFFMLSNVTSDLDYDMQKSTTTDFTSINTPTLSKVTTPRRTMMGRRSLRVLCSGAGEGIQTATIPNVMSRSAMAWVFGSVDVGSVTFSLYDVTGSADIGDTVSLEEEAEMLVRIPFQATPDTSKEIAIRAIGDTTTADFYLNGAGIMQRDNLRLSFPSAISERFKAPSIFMAVPQGNSDNSYIYPAHSIEYVQLNEGEHFTFMFHHPDANPYGIVLRDGYHMEWPIFVEAQIPASDLGTFAAEADTTVAPANVFIPRATLRVLDHVIIPRLGAAERWVATRAIAQKELDDALKVRATPVVAPKRREWYGPTRRRI